jgi:hypothetical protein
MPRLNGNTVTLGWDSIGSGVNEVELVRPAPKPDTNPTFDMLVDIAGVITRAKRDATSLQRIVEQYGLNPEGYDRSASIIASNTLTAVSHMVHSFNRSAPSIHEA